MDLYQIYKLFKQRAKRTPDCKVSEKIACLAKGMFSSNLSKKSLLKVIIDIQALEIFLPQHLKRYGYKMELAVQSGTYSAERPYQIRHKYYQKDLTGVIYLLSSANKKGQLKLGATTLEIDKRISLFQSRYGYPVRLVAAKLVRNVFMVEEMVAKELDLYRVSRQTSGDSNEWYAISYSKIWKQIEIAEQEINSAKA